MTELRKLDEVQTVPHAVIAEAVKPMTRDEKLQRLVKLLMDKGNKYVKTLHQIEYLHQSERAGYRVEGSVLSIAAADPVLQAQGLQNDTLGEGLRFFELPFGVMHYAFCYCISGSSELSGEYLGERFDSLREHMKNHPNWQGC